VKGGEDKKPLTLFKTFFLRDKIVRCALTIVVIREYSDDSIFEGRGYCFNSFDS